MAHVAESTHWYDRKGNPAYTVAAKDGSQRPTTLRDARKLDLVPSVTTIIRCADRPGLTNWMIDQGILAALTLPKLQDEAEKSYLARIKQDSKEQARKAAERGTVLHAAIQGHYEGKADEALWPYVQGAVKTVADWIDAPWTAERSFSHQLGFGGKCDLSHTRAQSDHPEAVLDFKTKEFGPDDDLKTWDEHAMQLAAYRHGLGMDQARCAIVYVSVTNPGLARLIEIPQPDLAKGWKCFYSLLQFWKAKTGLESGFERIAA